MARQTVPSNGLWSAIATILNSNFLELYRQSGWGRYIDGEYTSGSPFAVAANTKTKIPNDAATVLDQEVPGDYVDGFYETVGSTIPGLAGDSLLITVELKTTRQSGSGAYDFVAVIDVGGTAQEIHRKSIHTTGGAAEPIHFEISALVLEDWAANGAEIYVVSSAAINVFDIQYTIQRLHKGFGTY